MNQAARTRIARSRAAKRQGVECCDCGAKGLKKWQVAPAMDKGIGAFYRCGPCSVAFNNLVGKADE